MGETIRSVGLRAVKQLSATTWLEIECWLREWSPDHLKMIRRIRSNSGSDDVTMCMSWEEVRSAFMHIIGKVHALGYSST